MSSLNTPVSTTVFAFDLASASNELVQVCFEQTVVLPAGRLGFLICERPDAFTLTLAPDAVVDNAIARLDEFIINFERRSAPTRIRAVVHYGVVFRHESAGVVSYLGSAIRAASTALSRAHFAAGFFSTRDFSRFAAGLIPRPQSFTVEMGNEGTDNLSPVRLAGQAAPAPAKGPLVVDRLTPTPKRIEPTFSATKAPTVSVSSQSTHVLNSRDVEFLLFMKKRLAAEIGPFASPLVDSACRLAGTAKELATALSHEVDNPAARSRFEADALAYIKSRGAK